MISIIDYGEYFKQEEFSCSCGCGRCDMNQELINKLNTVRTILNKPIHINSGFRCKEHNKKIGSTDTSSHLVGLAADLKAVDSSSRYELLKVLLFVGFTRFGIDKDFIHVDIDSSKSQNLVYLY